MEKSTRVAVLRSTFPDKIVSIELRCHLAIDAKILHIWACGCVCVAVRVCVCIGCIGVLVLVLNVLINCHLRLFCSHGKLAFMQLAIAWMPQSLQKAKVTCLPQFSARSTYFGSSVCHKIWLWPLLANPLSYILYPESPCTVCHLLKRKLTQEMERRGHKQAKSMHR